VSCYAFFKGWLLLSKPPGCLRRRTSLTTELILGTLANDLGCSPFDDGTSLSPSHSRLETEVFGDCHSLVGRKDPRTETVLYPLCGKNEAAPKGISERTSYLRVRLAFHPYPQVIPKSCDTLWFGPPPRFRGASPCPWIAHPVSGLVHATINALFGLAFAVAPGKTPLAKPHTANSLAHSTKGTPSPIMGSDSLNASHFRDYFIPLSGCFSPFPHGTVRYRSLHLFSLGWWSTRVRAGLHVSDRTQEIPTVYHSFSYGALTLFGRPFQARSLREIESDIGLLQPPALSIHRIEW
jgi:hypothetical protein